MSNIDLNMNILYVMNSKFFNDVQDYIRKYLIENENILENSVDTYLEDLFSAQKDKIVKIVDLYLETHDIESCAMEILKLRFRIVNNNLSLENVLSFSDFKKLFS